MAEETVFSMETQLAIDRVWTVCEDAADAWHDLLHACVGALEYHDGGFEWQHACHAAIPVELQRIEELERIAYGEVAAVRELVKRPA
jgi:hypothetical protein